jgi:hypothetical protein
MQNALLGVLPGREMGFRQCFYIYTQLVNIRRGKEAGTGARAVLLAPKNPLAKIIAVDALLTSKFKCSVWGVKEERDLDVLSQQEVAPPW